MSYIGAEPTTAAFPFDQFSGTGAATSFTLTYAPASATSILVAISGVTQNPNLYSVIGTTLSFSPAPPAGTNNISVLYLGLPVIGSSSPGNTAFLSSTDLTATAGQTVFASAGSYTPGFVVVYRNGARLGNADFTATNGTTITLANAAAAGDLVTIEYYTLTSLVNALPLTGGTVTGSVTIQGSLQASGVATNLYPLVSSTAQASTSGTSIDFTGIPSWVKRITVMLNTVSTNGGSALLIQIGSSGGIETTGYDSIATTTTTTNNTTRGAGSTSGYLLSGSPNGAAATPSGAITLVNISSNAWLVSGSIADSNAIGPGVSVVGGTKSLSGTLTQVRITTVNGTDAFDAGSINILYEG